MNENGSIYVADNENDEVVQYDIGDNEGTIVAGGNGKSDDLNQLNCPYSVFVDQDYSVHVSDEKNHRLYYLQEIIVDQLGTHYVADCLNGRVMRWFKGATQGDIIAGGIGDGEEANKLSLVNGLVFDSQGNLYVVDTGNACVQKFDIT
ncbi:unnamed protein product [Rotaria sordida]|uniref:Uncharacterized protein n=1 Tax=Rotaria sordida TaxID=392033 RepID=A0A814FEH5_9BILA|nr:unnamed protein product [Rotaria sordida]